MIKINLGGGRKTLSDFINIDLVPFTDGTGRQVVDFVMDIEKERLPYKNEEVDEIFADNILEHIKELRFVMNECHRVLKVGGKLWGVVPIAGTAYDYRDPTHVRQFIIDTFEYFTGQSPAKPSRPAHPKYADYGYYPWHGIKVEEDDRGLLIEFMLEPRKIGKAYLLQEDKEFYEQNINHGE